MSQTFVSGPPSLPTLQVSSTNLSFGSQALGLATKLTVTLNNSGTGPLTINGISISGSNSNDFTSTSGCGTSLAAGASCAIGLMFTPSVAGAESAVLSIPNNATEAPQVISLSGAGVAVEVPLPPTPTPPATTPTLPASLPQGMILWLANDAGVMTTGTAVSLWQDQSGCGNDAVQAAPANQPAVVAGNNGQKALRFDGKASFLTIPSLPISGITGMSVFLVSANTQNKPNAGYGLYGFLNWTETLGWGASFFGTYQTSSHFRFGTTQSGNEIAYQMPLNLGSSFGLSEWMHNGTTDSMWFNSQSVASYPGKLQTLMGSGSSVTLGRGDQNSYYPGEASEIIIYNRALTTAERQLVEQYLTAKYHL
jgi:hypothetical protein